MHVSRVCALSFVLLLQLWVGWTFLHSQMERAGSSSGSGTVTSAESKPKQPKTGQGVLQLSNLLSCFQAMFLHNFAAKKKGQGEARKADKASKVKSS